jgi:hypothetical protein
VAVKNLKQGWMPLASISQRMTAATALPGMPRVSMGMRAPPMTALLALSLAARPSTTPVP